MPEEAPEGLPESSLPPRPDANTPCVLGSVDHGEAA